MRKSIKKAFAVLSLSVVFLGGFGGSAFAAGSKDANKPVKIEKKNAIYDESLGKYVTPLKEVDGQLVPVSKEEYENEIENSEEVDTEGMFTDDDATSDGDVSILRDYYEYYRYTPSSTTNVTGGTKKVTADIGCTTSTCRIDKAVSVTVSATYSVSLTAEKDAIKANAGFSWTSSASDSSTYSFTLSKGNSGYIGFKPYLKKTSGTLKRYSNWDGLLSSKSAHAYSPRKTSSGEADGYYYFVHY
ncbi:hypothetical protein [Cytobacillus firmus]|uniref:DUF6060 domain-containing protein n=1 Tax=Cytobacillus firmus TaxID=1399 RepID=UPI002493E3CF|nr:hypothetical protein [Cytobacillus firmus]